MSSALQKARWGGGCALSQGAAAHGGNAALRVDDGDFAAFGEDLGSGTEKPVSDSRE